MEIYLSGKNLQNFFDEHCMKFPWAMSLSLALWEFGRTASNLVPRTGWVSRLEQLVVVERGSFIGFYLKENKPLTLLRLSWVLIAEWCLSAFPCLFFVMGLEMNSTADFLLPWEGIETIRKDQVGISLPELSLLETAMLWLCLSLFGLYTCLVWHPSGAKGSTVKAVQGSG